MEEYLSRILYRIILPGSLFLAFIAIIPSLVQSLFGFPSAVAYLMGGTSLLILVGVDLDTHVADRGIPEDASSRRNREAGQDTRPQPVGLTVKERKPATEAMA